MSDDIVERLRDYAKSYRCGFGTTGDLLYEAADRIEQLEAELAAANNVAQALEDSAQEVRVKLAAANAKIEAARESDRVDLLLALGVESATPKPTDNSESNVVRWTAQRRSSAMFDGDCPGPVISTPEKCDQDDDGPLDLGAMGDVLTRMIVGVATEPETPSYIPNLSTDGQQKPCDARCGHNNHRIGCLNDPASEATVSDVAEAIYSAFGEERGLARRPKPLRVAYEVAAKAAIKAFVASKLKAEAT